jgi:hypothetical protein
MLYGAMYQGVSRRLSSRKAEFSPRLFYVEFVVDREALGQIFSFFIVCKIPSIFRMHSVICHRRYVVLATNSVVK